MAIIFYPNPPTFRASFRVELSSNRSSALLKKWFYSPLNNDPMQRVLRWPSPFQSSSQNLMLFPFPTVYLKPFWNNGLIFLSKANVVETLLLAEVSSLLGRYLLARTLTQIDSCSCIILQANFINWA
ncbi:hypothetical protein V6Z11_D01G181000 [Gossypium hirsutum]